MSQFVEILGVTGGRFLSEPYKCGDVFRCSFEPGDYTRQCELWDRVTTDIKEVRKDQWYRKLLRRVF